MMKYSLKRFLIVSASSLLIANILYALPSLPVDNQPDDMPLKGDMHGVPGTPSALGPRGGMGMRGEMGARFAQEMHRGMRSRHFMMPEEQMRESAANMPASHDQAASVAPAESHPTPSLSTPPAASTEMMRPTPPPLPKTPPSTVDISHAAPVSTPVPGGEKTGSRLWNLQDADILSVINEVSQETGKNFIIDPRVTGKITLISTKPLKQDEVYDVFLSVLGVLGYSAIPNGNMVKIVPNMEAGEQATSVATNNAPGKGDETVVRVIPLQNISAVQLIPVLRPMLPQWSNIASYNPSNILVLMGRASNLQRIVDVIQEVDQASNSGIQIVPLHHASAGQVATVLNNLQNASRATGEVPVVSIAVDERSNSILLGGPKAVRLRMRLLIAQLDEPASSPSGNTEVIYLRYLQAKTFAPILDKIALNIAGKEGGGASSKYDASTAMAPPAPSASGSKSSGSSGDSSKDAPVNTTLIQAEPNTNAVIVTAPPALMTALKVVIAKLDVRPAEVMVEGIIAEVDEINLTALGIQWGSSPSTSSSSSSGSTTTSNGTVTSFPPLGAGVVGIIPGTDIQAVLSVLQNQTGVDILSTPSIMVLDNQKATIEIGQDVPTQNGSYSPPTATNANTVAPFTTIDYKKVTLKLDVTPQINLACSVRLKLALKNDTLQNPQNPGLTPLINTSAIQNSVLVNSNDVLVIGGLISNSNNESINKVPILGDLPILGPLFTQKTTTVQKRNLVVFIKPIIVKSGDDAMIISHDKYADMRSIQANYRDDLRDIGKTPAPTLMPPWKNKKDLPTPFGSRHPQ